MENRSLQLWSMCNLREDEEPVEAMLEETELSMPDLETRATSSLLQWTTLRPTTLGSLSSDPRFHSTQIFRMASSSPSTSIESQILRSSISASQPAQLPARLLLNWTLPERQLQSSPKSYPSRSTKALPEVSTPSSSEGSSGTAPKRINSGSFTRAVGRLTSRGKSRSPSP
nr:P4 movement protein [Cherry luteovirus A]